MQRIIESQGRSAPLDWSAAHQVSVRSRLSGVVTAIDGQLISGIARQAGAPSDKTAGVYLQTSIGDRVCQGDVLFDVYGTDVNAVQQAVETATHQHGILIH